jgi:hypothetical protein
VSTQCVVPLTAGSTLAATHPGDVDEARAAGAGVRIGRQADDHPLCIHVGSWVRARAADARLGVPGHSLRAEAGDTLGVRVRAGELFVIHHLNTEGLKKLYYGKPKKVKLAPYCWYGGILAQFKTDLTSLY